MFVASVTAQYQPGHTSRLEQCHSGGGPLTQMFRIRRAHNNRDVGSSGIVLFEDVFGQQGLFDGRLHETAARTGISGIPIPVFTDCVLLCQEGHPSQARAVADRPSPSEPHSASCGSAALAAAQRVQRPGRAPWLDSRGWCPAAPMSDYFNSPLCVAAGCLPGLHCRPSAAYTADRQDRVFITMAGGRE